MNAVLNEWIEAVQFRYLGESADRPEAVLAVKTMKRCRMEIRQTLGLREND